MTWSEFAAAIQYRNELEKRRKDYEAAVEELRGSLEDLVVYTSMGPPSGIDHRRKRIQWYRGLTRVRQRAHKALQAYDEEVNRERPKL